MNLQGMDYLLKYIDNLNVDLLCPTCTSVSTFTFHSIICYYFIFIVLLQQTDDMFILV